MRKTISTEKIIERGRKFARYSRSYEGKDEELSRMYQYKAEAIVTLLADTTITASALYDEENWSKQYIEIQELIFGERRW